MYVLRFFFVFHYLILEIPSNLSKGNDWADKTGVQSNHRKWLVYHNAWRVDDLDLFLYLLEAYTIA